jgi:hypothetical protein
MTILDQAEHLRQQAISLLLQERGSIDQKLTQLGYDGLHGETKTRKSKACGRCGQEGHTIRTCSTTEENASGKNGVVRLS